MHRLSPCPSSIQGDVTTSLRPAGPQHPIEPLDNRRVCDHASEGRAVGRGQGFGSPDVAAVVHAIADQRGAAVRLTPELIETTACSQSHAAQNDATTHMHACRAKCQIGTLWQRLCTVVRSVYACGWQGLVRSLCSTLS